MLRLSFVISLAVNTIESQVNKIRDCPSSGANASLTKCECISLSLYVCVYIYIYRLYIYIYNDTASWK